MTASHPSCSAAFFAASGSSNAPGTLTIVTLLSCTPCRFNASSAPFSKLSTTSSLNRATTIVMDAVVAMRSPSITLVIVYLRLGSWGTPTRCSQQMHAHAVSGSQLARSLFGSWPDNHSQILIKL